MRAETSDPRRHGEERSPGTVSRAVATTRTNSRLAVGAAAATARKSFRARSRPLRHHASLPRRPIASRAAHAREERKSRSPRALERACAGRAANGALVDGTIFVALLSHRRGAQQGMTAGQGSVLSQVGNAVSRDVAPSLAGAGWKRQLRGPGGGSFERRSGVPESGCSFVVDSLARSLAFRGMA